MKDHWNKLPPEHPLRRRIEHVLGSSEAPAEAWRRAASIANGAGYDTDPPPRTSLERLAELRKTDQRAAGRYAAERSVELESERAAGRIFSGKRAWTAGPPQHQIEAQRAAAKKTAELDAAIEARAAQLVAEQATKSTETARARARKELTT
jgi:hypothetical protein